MQPNPKKLLLRPGRDRSLLEGHPWLFSGAIESIEGDPAAGDTVEIVNHRKRWLARAAFSPNSRIAARVWTFDPDQAIDDEFLVARLTEAAGRRRNLSSDPRVTAYREVHAESDLLPGIIIDRYGDYRVLQLLTPGAERLRDALVAALTIEPGLRGLYERSDAEIRELEGLQARTGPLWGDPPDPATIIREYDLSFEVDLPHGHKTGFYLDQRENRRRVAETLRAEEVLDAFSYTGGFAAAALRSGAGHVVSIEASEGSIELGRRNIDRNGFPPTSVDWIQGDVFRELRSLRDRGRSFDAVILDPPRFAPTVSQVQRAARGYKDINLLALKLLVPGGCLYTFSCSGGVSPDLFEKIVAGAAKDAGVHVAIEGWLDQPEDHPVGAHFPEGRYLKGLVGRRGQARWYPAAPSKDPSDPD
ncbi:MAG TPA: class I SAM-dependent rRNA methyltransferase [Anaerolineales bacterium]|nr:class I SAM-dependent rRNA methyltransferase [Anaerolineales bacterium]